jgi:hypothetical protein
VVVQSGSGSHKKETIKRIKRKLRDFLSVSPHKTEIMLEMEETGIYISCFISYINLGYSKTS